MTRSVTITGYSDDVISVDGDFGFSSEDSNYAKRGILFSDGSLFEIAFDSQGDGLWKIEPIVLHTVNWRRDQTSDGDQIVHVTGDFEWVASIDAVCGDRVNWSQ